MPLPLYPLLLLACPFGMGLMMWFMVRGDSHTMRRNDSVAYQLRLDELRREFAEPHAAQNDADHRARS
ncbi:hypothetical protein [Streptomyces sp. NPDC020489]|uniref:hypothetical protein n=1 Tax=Streptomyces sp. NPDC020489 TaxID=3365077 RepID=UPI00379CA346